MKKGTFETGDLVRLKSGGPKMTVIHASDSIGVSCCWFISDQERRASFPAVALQIAGTGRLTGDIFTRYDEILKHHRANSISVVVVRLTEPKENRVIAAPGSGEALRGALDYVHGESVPAEYEVRFIDIATKQWLGKGRATLPDTRAGFVPKKKSRRQR